jgi:hypothetical protein
MKCADELVGLVMASHIPFLEAISAVRIIGVRIAPATSAPLGCCKAPDRGAARLKTRAHNAGRALCPRLRNSGWYRERQALSGRDEIDHALTVARAQLLETIATGRALTAMP